MTDTARHLETRVRNLDRLADRAKSSRLVADTLRSDGTELDVADRYRAEAYAITGAIDFAGQIGAKVTAIPTQLDNSRSGINHSNRDRQIGVEIVNYLIDCGFTPPAGAFDAILLPNEPHEPQVGDKF